MTVYNYLISDTTNNKVALSELEEEIRNSTIVIALDFIDIKSNAISIFFKTDISSKDETTLDGIIAAHDAVPRDDNFLDVKVLEEDPNPAKRTNGYFGSETLSIDIPATVGEHTKAFIFPMDIAILSMEYVGIADTVDDSFDICIGTTTVGAITADVSTSDTIINISPTVAEFAFNGARCELDDGTNNDLVGRISNIDKTNLTANIQVSPSNAYLAATPTYIKVGAWVCKNIEIDRSDAPIQIGGSKIGGSFVSAGTPIMIHYQNNDGSAKKFRAVLEFLY